MQEKTKTMQKERVGIAIGKTGVKDLRRISRIL